jgi:hypothetical protein
MASSGAMMSETFSPRRPEGVSPRRPQQQIATTSTLGVVSFLKDLDKIQEQQIHYTKKLERQKKKKFELEEHIEVSSSAGVVFAGSLILSS